MVPEAHAIFGFDAAAMIPVLIEILGVDLKNLATIIKQLCHQRATEAAMQGQVVLTGEILKQVAPPGSGTWAPRVQFDPAAASIK